MGRAEETIQATLDGDGQLRLARPPGLPPGPVRVTIRVASPTRLGLADTIRRIASDRQARGAVGRPASELLADDEERQAEDDERDRELDGARRGAVS